MLINLTTILLLIGTTFSQDARIVNGDEVKPFSYSFMVSLQKNGKHFCGGSLLNRNTVLTAAHCFEKNLNNVTVSIHRHDLRKTSLNENGIDIAVQSINNHPKYTPNDLIFDVSVWKLKTSIPNSIPVEFVSLDINSAGFNEGLESIAIGWGRTDSYAEVGSPVLIEAVLPVYNFEQCKDGYLGSLIKEHHLCAGYKQAIKSACYGDSGGPLFIKQNGQTIQIGIASFVSKPRCLWPKRPTVFSRISSYIEFINSF